MNKRSPLLVVVVVLLVLAVAAWSGRHALWSWLLALHGVHRN